MNKKQYGLIVMLALVGGFIGGVISGQLFVGKTVFAQNEPSPQKLLVANEFRLIDKEGNTLAVLGQEEFDKRLIPVLRFGDKQNPPHSYMSKYGLSCRSKDWRCNFLHSGFQLYENRENLTFADALLSIEPPLSSLHGLGYKYPSIELRDNQRNTRLRLAIHDDSDEPYLELRGKLKGDYPVPRLRVRLGQSNIALYDEDGNLRTVLGSTTLEVPHTGEKELRPVSSLVLFDKKGKVLWSAP